MKSTEHWLVHDHTKIEFALGQLRKSAEINDWEAAHEALLALATNLKFHMAQEEEVLFPAYEAKANLPNLPTDSLRSDHTRIVQLICELNDIIKKRNPVYMQDTLPLLETVLLSHHEKEETIFLPMVSHILFGEREELSAKLANFTGAQHPREWCL